MGVEWSSERMTVRPFGSLEMAYWSRGGGMAAWTGDTRMPDAIATSEAIGTTMRRCASETRPANVIAKNYGIRLCEAPALTGSGGGCDAWPHDGSITRRPHHSVPRASRAPRAARQAR